LEWSIGSNPNASTGTGWAAGGKLGYDFVGPRIELEGGYGQLPTSANIPGTAINGKVGQATAMANLLYDFMPTSSFTPYIGVGAGRRAAAAAADGSAAVVHGVLRLGPLEPLGPGPEHDQAGGRRLQVQGQCPRDGDRPYRYVGTGSLQHGAVAAPRQHGQGCAG